MDVASNRVTDIKVAWHEESKSDPQDDEEGLHIE